MIDFIYEKTSAIIFSLMNMSIQNDMNKFSIFLHHYYPFVYFFLCCRMHVRTTSQKLLKT